MQTAHEVKALAEMVRIVCPDGNITVGISPVSPLTFPYDITDAILEVARQGMVLGPLPCPILGATAPMSIAGGLVRQNAEVLASIVLAHLVRPGLPIIYKGRLSVMDPFTGLSVWGNPEIGLISSATVEISHYYGMPVDVYGLCTNAHILDIQNGYERALNALMPVLAGADEISGVGEMEGGVSSSITQIVIDDEILSSIQRLKDGFTLDKDSLGVEVITKVMERSRNYLAEKHTIQYLRNGEVLTPPLAVRDSWSQWEKSGRLGLEARAENKAEKLLNDHEIPPLSDDQIAELEKVILAFSRV
jgi:trimethylamine--corrinoid protein Co-methyltransferase